VLGLIDIPSIGLSAVFLEGVSNQTLLTGPGHLPWTGLPGSKGVSVLAAHRDMHFRSLKDVPAGARVTLRLPGRSLAYRVTGHAIVGPDARWVTASGEQPILRLVTCWPPNFIGPAPQRLVLTALPIEPAGRADPAGAAGDPGVIPAAAPGPASPAPLGLPLSVSGTSGDIFPAASLPWIGSAGASLAGLAAFGAWTTRRKLLWWFLPWVGGLGLTCLVLLSAWGGPRILAAG
jgi:LPXTG-site transpeptidase (sortase) family protein